MTNRDGFRRGESRSLVYLSGSAAGGSGQATSGDDWGKIQVRLFVYRFVESQNSGPLDVRS